MCDRIHGVVLRMHAYVHMRVARHGGAGTADAEALLEQHSNKVCIPGTNSFITTNATDTLYSTNETKFVD